MDYKRLKNILTAVALIGFLLFAFLSPNISYAGGFLLGTFAGYIGFYWIVETVKRAPLNDIGATKRRLYINHLLRIIFYAMVLMIALIFPNYFQIIPTFLGLFVVKLSLAISQYKFKKGS